MIDFLSSESETRFSAERRNRQYDLITPAFYDGMLTAPFSGFKRGLVDLPAVMAVDAFTDDENIGKEHQTWLDRENQKTRDTEKSTRLDPETNGLLAQVFHQVGEMAGLGVFGAAVGAAVTAPVGGIGAAPGALGAIVKGFEYEQYLRSFEETKNKLAAVAASDITGMATLVGGGLPAIIGNTLAKQVVAGVGVNIGLGMAERGGISQVMTNMGYPDIAKHYQAFDATAMFLDAAFGASIPLGLKAGTAIAERYNKVGSERTIQQIAEASIGKPIDIETTNAVLAANMAKQETDSMVGAPVRFEDIDAYRAQQQSVIRQLDEGVDPANIKIDHSVIKEMELVPNPEHAKTAAAIKEVMDEYPSGMRKMVEEPAKVKPKPIEPVKIKPSEGTKAGETIESTFDSFQTNKARQQAETMGDKIITWDGGEGTAKEVMDAAEKEVAEAQQLGALHEVAINCFLKRG